MSNLRLAQCLTCKKHPATCEAKDVDEFGLCQEQESIFGSDRRGAEDKEEGSDGLSIR